MKRPNPDEDERALERAAKLGDSRAQRKLDQMRARRGQKQRIPWGGVPDYEVLVEHVSALGDVKWPYVFLSRHTSNGTASNAEIALHRELEQRHSPGRVIWKSRVRHLEVDNLQEAWFMLMALADIATNGGAWDYDMWLEHRNGYEELAGDTAARMLSDLGYEWVTPGG